MGSAIAQGLLLLLIQFALLVAATWAINRFITGPSLRAGLGSRLPRAALSTMGWIVTIGLVSAAFFFGSQPGQSRFEQLCAEHAKPRIVNPVRVDGFYRETLSNPDAQRYLGHAYQGDYYENDPFTFIEGPAIDGNGNVRFTWSVNGMRKERVTELRSRHGVRAHESRPFLGIAMRQKTVYEMGSGKLVAEAVIVEFNGGPLPSLFFGSFAKSICEAQILPYYHLEKDSLRISAP